MMRRAYLRADDLASGRQEDLLMEALKQAEAQIDVAVSAILRHLPHLNSAAAQQASSPQALVLHLVLQILRQHSTGDLCGRPLVHFMM